MNLRLTIDPSLEARLNQILERVELELHAATQFPDPLAQISTHHLMDAGGKRLRPLLALVAAQFGPDADNDEVLDAAVVVELIHLATLYHDDVMDSAPLRRGAPSAHEVWGNHVAILTGDLLFARSSLLMSKLGPEAVRIQAETFERLVLGQLHETVGPTSPQSDAPEVDPISFYLGVLGDKTASLTAAAARLGAKFAGASPEAQAAVARYGEALGVAFQLADDVLDFTATSSGKALGTDLRDGVATMPVLLLQHRVTTGQASAAEQGLVAQLTGDLTEDAELASLISRIGQSNVIGQTLALAEDWSAAAIAALADLPDCPAKEALTQLAQAVVTRSV